MTDVAATLAERGEKMIEKCTKAIEAEIVRQCGVNGGAVKFPSVHYADVCGGLDTDDLAQAVLATLAEPDAAMVEAGAKRLREFMLSQPYSLERVAGNVFTAMIGSASPSPAIGGGE